MHRAMNLQYTDFATAYLDALDRLMVLSDLPAWNTHIRFRAWLWTSPKRHFCDPSLACAALIAIKRPDSVCVVPLGALRA
ncbi:MAG: DUF4143 domain-containing protein [Propionibacteriaceae bacterium]|nr:DUF4143 domain-containing protein [Propionibacteriaceae bacterium]